MLEKIKRNQSTGEIPLFPQRTRKITGKSVSMQTLFLGDKKEVQKLSRSIPQELKPVGILESTWEIDRLPSDVSPRLVVTLDSFSDGISLRLLRKIKKKLSAAAMICLVDSISNEREIELRSAGLVFLGSPQRFLHHASEIVGNVCKSAVV